MVLHFGCAVLILFVSVAPPLAAVDPELAEEVVPELEDIELAPLLDCSNNGKGAKGTEPQPGCFEGYVPGGNTAVDCLLYPYSFQSTGTYRGFCPAKARQGTVLEFGSGATTVFVGGLAQHKLAAPTDLSFHPQHPGQLWVVNRETNSASIFFNPGGTPNKPMNQQPVEWRQDNEACHFMSHPTSIAFGGATRGSAPHPCNQRVNGGKFPRWRHPGGDCSFYSEKQTSAWGSDFVGGKSDGLLEADGTFLTGADDDQTFDMYMPSNDQKDIKETNENPKIGVAPMKFMGPTLWPAGLEYFAIKNNDVFTSSAGLFPEASHLSMVHEQPFSFGVAWSGHGAKYYTWDSGDDAQYGSVTEVDFVKDHGFGGVTHPEIYIKRFAGLQISRVSGNEFAVPGHMALCPEGHTLHEDGEAGACNSKWLYIADPGGRRVVRLDVTSGHEAGPVKPWFEWREGYYNYSSVVDSVFEVVAENKGRADDLVQPTGIAISRDSQRLFVSDFATGAIHAFDISSSGSFSLLQKFETGAQGIAGLAIDAVDRLWFVDSSMNELRMINPHCDSVAHCDAETHPFDSTGSQDDTPPVNPANPSQTLYDHFKQDHFTYHGCTRMYFNACPLLNEPAESMKHGFDMLKQSPLVPCPEQSKAGGYDPFQSGRIFPDPSDPTKSSWINMGDSKGDLLWRSWKPYEYAIVSDPFSPRSTCTCVWPNGTKVKFPSPQWPNIEVGKELNSGKGSLTSIVADSDVEEDMENEMENEMENDQ